MYTAIVDPTARRFGAPRHGLAMYRGHGAGAISMRPRTRGDLIGAPIGRPNKLEMAKTPIGAPLPRRGRDFEKVTLSLAKRLRRLRAARGWTQRTAALRMGIGPPLVRRLERGMANPSLAVLVSVADAFGVALNDLIGR
jgi:DNA-binding XRE family transcriptional regulator